MKETAKPSVRAHRIAAGTLFLAVVLGLATAAARTPPARPSRSVPIVELRGDGHAMGVEHGRLLGDEIRDLLSHYLRPMMGSSYRHFMARAAAGEFRSRIRPTYQQEVDALAEAARIDSVDAMVAQCFLDLRPMTACSTIALPAEAAPDHVARLGRNLEYASLGIADKHSVVLAYRPEGRFAFVSIGWPGLIGVLSGINEHGLCLANMEVPRPQRTPSAVPYTILYRMVLEECRTVEDAVAMFRREPRQTANNVMLMDAAGGCAVVEITPESVVVRNGRPESALVSTNHQRGQDQDRHGLCKRYDCLHDAAAADFGRIDVDRLRSYVARASLGDMTMQSMIFEPSTRTIYLSTGKNASHGEFRKIDLGPYLRR